MSGQGIENEDPNVIAARAERELNSAGAKTGNRGASDSANESGVDQSVESRFPGAEVKYGSDVSGGGNNSTITDEEGGGIKKETGKQTKAQDFEGIGGPEDKVAVAEQDRGGDQDVTSNISK